MHKNKFTKKHKTIFFPPQNPLFRIYFNMKKDYILFIDSGIGGLSTLAETMKKLPSNYIFYADNKHSPYGNHSKTEILIFLTKIIYQISKKYQISAVVLACNTATTSCVGILRKIFKNLTIIGTEPALKLAKNSGFYDILCLSTPTTARQMKYKQLKNSLNVNIKTLSLGSFASEIEEYFCTGSYFSYAKLLKTLCYICNNAQNFQCIVLGCTHYCLVQVQLFKLAAKSVINGNLGVQKQVLNVLKPNYFNNQNSPKVKFIFSNPTKFAKQNYKKILGQILAKQ